MREKVKKIIFTSIIIVSIIMFFVSLYINSKINTAISYYYNPINATVVYEDDKEIKVICNYKDYCFNSDNTNIEFSIKKPLRKDYNVEDNIFITLDNQIATEAYTGDEIQNYSRIGHLFLIIPLCFTFTFVILYYFFNKRLIFASIPGCLFTIGIIISYIAENNDILKTIGLFFILGALASIIIICKHLKIISTK